MGSAFHTQWEMYGKLLETRFTLPFMCVSL